WSACWKRLRRSFHAARVAALRSGFGARTYGRTLSGMKWLVATTGMSRFRERESAYRPMTKCACVWTTSGRMSSSSRDRAGRTSHGMQIIHVGCSGQWWERRRWTRTPSSQSWRGIREAEGATTSTSCPTAARPVARRLANAPAPLISGGYVSAAMRMRRGSGDDRVGHLFEGRWARIVAVLLAGATALRRDGVRVVAGQDDDGGAGEGAERGHAEDRGHARVGRLAEQQRSHQDRDARIHHGESGDHHLRRTGRVRRLHEPGADEAGSGEGDRIGPGEGGETRSEPHLDDVGEIGRASCRERE